MENKSILNKDKVFISLVILGILILFFAFLIFYTFYSLKKYEDAILPNTYVGSYNMSDYTFGSAKKKLEASNDSLLLNKIKLKINSKDYEYTYGQLGVLVDWEKTIDNIRKYQNSLKYSQLIRGVNGKIKKKFDVIYKVDEVRLKEFLFEVKRQVDVAVVNGYFDTSNGVKYVEGQNGFSLNTFSSYEILSNELAKGVSSLDVIELGGDSVPATTNDSYKNIDTMTSSFVTKFNVYQGTRPINLRSALNYINGVIVEPGEVFSYYKYAGPYNKAGYVFYYEFVGNGVCQIATTVYNAVLLGGLEVVKRYPHAKKSVYVPGGLDATVASYSSGWNVDFQFKNTYKYPIYIKAYDVSGEAHVEFWSNKEAKEGKTYSTESVNIGIRGYTTYLHTYKDGVEISRDKITTTWYNEE